VAKVSAKWPHSSGFTLEKLEVANNGAITTETSLTGVAPGLKLEFKGNDSNKGDLSFTYHHQHGAFTSELDALHFAKASASLVTGQAPLFFGLATDVNISKQVIGPVTAAVGYSIPNVLQGVLKASKNFSDYNSLLSYSASKDLTLAGQIGYASSTPTFLVGALYKLNPELVLKFKVSNHAFNLSAKQSLDKKLTVVGSVEVPRTLDGAKFGIVATLG